MHLVPSAESANDIGPVLVHATDQIIGHSDVKCPMLATGENINVIHGRIVRDVKATRIITFLNPDLAFGRHFCLTHFGSRVFFLSVIPGPQA
jgi:hypothetical protein